MRDLTLKFDGKFGERLDGWDIWRKEEIVMPAWCSMSA
jgi:hypothetical protein